MCCGRILQQCCYAHLCSSEYVMDNIFDGVSKLLVPNIKLLEYTELTQNQVGRSDVVLWDKRPLSVSRNIYQEFIEAVKKRQQKYYFRKNILSYHDFCLALICCIQYSLNHTVTLCILDKGYSAAWRTIEVISSTASKDVKEWLNKYIADRSSTGYCNELRVVQDNATIFMSSSPTTTRSSNNRDVEIISNIDRSTVITEITRMGDYDLTKVHDDIGIVFESTCTPEGQLYDLMSAHSLFNNRLF